MNTFVLHALPGLLLGLLFKSVGLLLAAGAACLLLRRASAATRHLIWSASLGGLLLLPLLMLTLPHWDLAVRRATTQVSPRPLPPVPTVPPPSVPRPQPSAPVAVSPVLPVPMPEARPLTPAAPMPLPPVSPAPLPSRPVHAPIPWHLVWPVAGLALWLLGVLAILARLAVGLRRVELIRRRAVPLDAATLALAESLRDGFGLRRPVTFLRASVGSGVSVPLTWGGRRATVLLPEQSGAWPADTCRAALLHELAHVSRWDWTTQTLGRLACALYWVNPLVWVAARVARAESERACDDCVLGEGLSAADYAQNLVDVVRSMPPGPSVRTAAIAMAQPSEVESRLRALLAKGRNRRPITRRLALGTLAALAVVALPLAALHLVEARAAVPDSFTAVDAIQPAPGGGTIRLVGIGEFPDANKTWWGKDGVRLTAPPAWSMDHGVTMSKPPQGQAYRQIVLEATGTAPGDDFTVQAPPSAGGGMSWGGEHIGSPIPIGWVGAFPLAEKTCTVRVGIAHTPWQMLASDGGFPAGGSSGSDTAEGVGSVTYSFSTLSEIKGKVAITVADTATGLPTRVVAIDTQGRTVPGDTTGGDSSIGSFHQRTVTFPGLALKDIKDIQLQWRPYDWVEFKNVPLQPVTTAAAAAPPAPFASMSAYAIDAAQTAPDGRSAHLAGVSTFPSAGMWWDKDGIRLPKPPASWHAPVQTYFVLPDGQKARVFVLNINRTRPDDTFRLPQDFLWDDSTNGVLNIETYPLPGRSGGIALCLIRGLPAAQTIDTFRLGVASRPWTVVETKPLAGPNQATLFQGNSAEMGKYQARLSPPSIVGGVLTFTVSDTLTSPPTRYQSFRLIAIDTQGRRVFSRFDGWGYSARVIQRTLTFPKLALKDIKSIQLLWRPYDWFEFKNVSLQSAGAAPQKETAMNKTLIAPAIALFGFSAAAAPVQVPPVNASATVVQKAEVQKAAQADALAHQIAVQELELALNAPLYGPGHPLIVSTRTELADSYADLATLHPPDGATLIADAAGAVMEPKIAELTQQEKTAEKRYGLNHPSVARPKAQIAGVRQRLNELRQAAAQSAGQTSSVPALRPAAQITTAASPLTAAQAMTVIQQTCSRLDAAVNRKDLAAAMAFFAPEFVTHDPIDGTLVTQTVLAANLHEQFSQPGQIGERTQVLQATASGNKITALVHVILANPRDEKVARETWRRTGQGWAMTGMDVPKASTAPTPKPAAVPAPAKLRPVSAAPAARPLTAAQAKAAIQQACSHMDAVLDSKDVTAVLALLTPGFYRQSPEGAVEDQVAFAADLQRLFARPGPLNAQTRVLKVTLDSKGVTAIVTQSFARRADSDTPQAFTLSERWRRTGGVWRLGIMEEYNEITPTPAPPAAAKTSRTAPGPNRLTNAGAEVGTGSAPDGWKQGMAVDGVTYLWDRKVAHTGTASLCLQKVKARYFPIADWSQAIPYAASAGSVTVSAWVKAQNTTKAVLDVLFLDANGKPISHQWAAYIGSKTADEPPVTHDWRLYTDTVPVPVGTKQVVIAPELYGPGTVWFDDLQTKYVS